MNNEKVGNLLRVIAVILIAVLALCLIGATAHGGFLTPEDDDSTNADKEPNDENTPPPSQDTAPPDEDKPSDTEKEPEVVLPTFYSKLTGLAVSEEEYLKQSLALVYSQGSALYAVSSAELVIEIPIDISSSRYIVYIKDYDSLGKLGTLAPARDNFLLLHNTFGGIFCANGNDGYIRSNTPSTLHIDLKQNSGYSYNESVLDTYSSGELISKYIVDKQIDLRQGSITTLPFLFSDEDVVGGGSCNIITLPHSDKLSTTLVFDKTSAKYKLTSLGKEQTDMLNGSCASFTNALILFANSTTYERADLVETVIDTASGGGGYYASLGGLTEIRWECDALGRITFKTLTGESLYINRGNTYIGYFKASCAKDVKFE